MTLNGDLKTENRRISKELARLRFKLKKARKARDELLAKNKRLLKIERMVQKLVLVFKENVCD